MSKKIIFCVLIIFIIQSFLVTGGPIVDSVSGFLESTKNVVTDKVNSVVDTANKKLMTVNEVDENLENCDDLIKCFDKGKAEEAIYKKYGVNVDLGNGAKIEGGTLKATYGNKDYISLSGIQKDAQIEIDEKGNIILHNVRNPPKTGSYTLSVDASEAYSGEKGISCTISYGTMCKVDGLLSFKDGKLYVKASDKVTIDGVEIAANKDTYIYFEGEKHDGNYVSFIKDDANNVNRIVMSGSDKAFEVSFNENNNYLDINSKENDKFTVTPYNNAVITISNYQIKPPEMVITGTEGKKWAEFTNGIHKMDVNSDGITLKEKISSLLGMPNSIGSVPIKAGIFKENIKISKVGDVSQTLWTITMDNNNLYEYRGTVKYLGDYKSTSPLIDGTFNKNRGFIIKEDSDKKIIEELQSRLYALGYLKGRYNHGELDQLTITAIEKLQKENSLVVDGVFGPKTYAKMKSLLNEKTSSGTLKIVDEESEYYKKLPVEEKERLSKLTQELNILIGNGASAEEINKLEDEIGKIESEKYNYIEYEKYKLPKHIDNGFLAKVEEISPYLGTNPTYLLAAMKFETIGTLDPAITNKGSGATGLIQFLPSTAKNLGTTTKDLRSMTATEQLEYVKKYLEPYKGHLNRIEDVYLAILAPAAIGKSLSSTVYSAKESPGAYNGNQGLDHNHDGIITVTEATVGVKGYFKESEGLFPEMSTS